MQAAIRAIEYYLPDEILANSQLAAEFPEWGIEKIEEKTGISERHIAGADQCASDLGVEAGKKLFDSGVCKPEDIDYILFCTQSPDYFLPSTACVMQNRLNIPKAAGALDFNLGCSGFVYGIGLAKGLIETSQANTVLLITAETYSKFIHPKDKSVRTIFGDAGAAILIQGVNNLSAELEPWIGPFVYGTDGRGAKNLIVPSGGMRTPRSEETSKLISDDSGNLRTADNLYMNGNEIFTFTLSAVPKSINELLARSKKAMDDIDLFVFHQANKFMLEHLQKKLKIPEEKFYLSFQYVGNTVSSTIPIALKNAHAEGKLKAGDQVMLVGFGVGYSWGAALVRWF
jgi:3-oxoacyl-[acyl-carrier-protein] synthase III